MKNSPKKVKNTAIPLSKQPNTHAPRPISPTRTVFNTPMRGNNNESHSQIAKEKKKKKKLHPNFGHLGRRMPEIRASRLRSVCPNFGHQRVVLRNWRRGYNERNSECFSCTMRNLSCFPLILSEKQCQTGGQHRDSSTKPARKKYVLSSALVPQH